MEFNLGKETISLKVSESVIPLRLEQISQRVASRLAG